MFRRILYSKPMYLMMLFFCRIFYPKRYLKGRYFEEKRAGFWWAIKGIPRRLATGIPWPLGKTTVVNNKNKISFHPDSINVFQSPGCYFQNIDGTIKIGRNVHIAPNVGLITTNHNIYDLNSHITGKDIVLGDNCWIGMNSVILPGVVLGNRTVVGAGAVVTKSFSEGNCVIGGVPAKIIRRLEEKQEETQDANC